MKVLLLSNFGMGLYKFRKELLQELINQDHKVFVSFPYDEYVEVFRDMDCKYIETRVDRRGISPITDMKLVVEYVKIIKRIKPDVVLTYTIKPNIYGGFACRLTKTNYFASITGLGTAIEDEGVIKRVILYMYKVALRDCKCIFFQNEPNKRFFIDSGIQCDNMLVTPGSGVNLLQYQYEEYPEDKNNIRFLFVGRIMKAKGINELLEAAECIKKSHKNIEFHIVGFCEEDYLKRLRELDSAGIVHYHGQQDNVHKFIKSSHATILPSYHEGTSNVLLESASTGRPILASNVTGCKEAFDEGVSGIGFEPKNVDDLIVAIKKFIDLSYEAKIEMGKSGRKKMEKEYDRRIVVNAYTNQINQLWRS